MKYWKVYWFLVGVCLIQYKHNVLDEKRKVCGIDLWIYNINVPLGGIIFVCVAISFLFWVIYTIKNWRCPHCGHDRPGLYD